MENIFESNRFELEIRTVGCFTTHEEEFAFMKQIKGYKLSSKRSKKHKFISNAKMDSLKLHFSTRIGKDMSGGCTAHTYVRLGTHFNSVNYRHSYCLGEEASGLRKILNHNDLIPFEEED